MMDRNDMEALARLSHSLEHIATYLGVVDRAENLRRGDHPNTRSSITREMAMARAILATLMAQGTEEGTSTGALLAHITDTAGDPAGVRESMTDRQANELLQDSLVQTGTTTPEARTIADFYVPVQDQPARTQSTRDFPAPYPWYGQVDCDTEDALLARLKEHERTSPTEDTTRPRWEGREGSAQAQNHAPTPRDLASRLHRED